MALYAYTLKSRNYQVFLDLIPIRSPRRVLLGTSFKVSGKPEDPYLEEGKDFGFPRKPDFQNETLRK